MLGFLYFVMIHVRLKFVINGGWKYFDKIKKGRLFILLLSKYIKKSCLDLYPMCEIFIFGDNIYQLINYLFGHLLELCFQSIVL
jgi:hypothetical protein